LSNFLYTRHPMREVTASDFLTEAEFTRVRELFTSGLGKPSFAASCVYEILLPIMPRINEHLTFTCDPWDFAYALEYRLFKDQPRKGPKRDD